MEREKRADLRAGVIAALIVNHSPRRRRTAKTVTPETFFPNLKRKPREQTPEEQRQAILAVAALAGGRIRRVSPEEFKRIRDGRR